MSNQIAIWIDHKEARIFTVHIDGTDEKSLLAPHPVHHTHRRDTQTPEHDKRFFHDVVRSLEDAEQVLVVGPSTAKLEFIRYVEKHDAATSTKIIGVETVDHPTDAQLAAYAKAYFKKVDAKSGS